MSAQHIRHLTPDDYLPIISVVDAWWGGRPMHQLLPKLFFIHFQQTSFVSSVENTLAGFLIGFLSQTYPDEAYIHFVGVHPTYRKQGLARHLYEQFFSTVRQHQRHIVRCITTPTNTLSLAFHQRMGFTIEQGPVEQDGIACYPDYDGRGGARVLFRKQLDD